MKNYKPMHCKFRAEDTVEVEAIRVGGMPVVHLETRDGDQECGVHLSIEHAKRLRRRLKAAIADAEAPGWRASTALRTNSAPRAHELNRLRVEVKRLRLELAEALALAQQARVENLTRA